MQSHTFPRRTRAFGAASILALLLPLSAEAAASITETSDGSTLATQLTGGDANITNVSGITVLGTSGQHGLVTNTSLGIVNGSAVDLSAPGIILSTGNTSATGGNRSEPGDADVFQALTDHPSFTTSETNDAAGLSFSFQVSPGKTSVSFDLVFATDEGIGDTSYLDAAVVIVDGTNYAVFPNGLLLSNYNGDFLFAASDVVTGFSNVSTLQRVTALLDTNLSTHTIKIVVADNNDGIVDSALIIAGMTAGASSSGGISDAPELDNDGSVTAAGGVTEPVSLDTTVDTTGEAVNIFDFTISEGGTADSVALGVTQIVVHVSGTASDAQRAQVTWRLNGPDASNVTGTYNAGADTITFPGLSISVADGGNETYTLNAYFNDNTNLIEGLTYILSTDGDTDFTLDSAGTQIGATSAVTNGSGSAVNVVATRLAFTTQPAGSVSGSALTTQPVVTAQDAFGNTDVDFTETITLTEASAGSLLNATVAAVNGVATFTNTAYLATADQQSFTLTANDQDGVGSDLPTATANAVTSDVVATQLVFTTEPAPTSIANNTASNFTTVPVVAAIDGNAIVDTGYSTDTTLAEVNGAGSAILSGTGDTDGNAATVSITPSSGVATFTGLQLTYTAAGASDETFNLRASSGGLTAADSVQLTAVVNQPPTDLALDATTVAQSAGVNGVVGNLTTTDGDSSVFTYTLVSGAGATDNASFNIASAQLRANDASSLAAGSYSVRVRTSDGIAGYEEVFTITVVDDVAPAAPSTPDLDSDSGTSATDDVTNVTTPTFTGTAEAGSTVTLRSASDVIGTATATGGAWSITTSALAQAIHNVTATATDAAGNTSASSSAVAVTIDTTAPVITSAATAVATYGASGFSHALTASGSPTAFAATGLPGGVGIDAGTGIISGTPTAVGSFTVTTQATDAAGNTGSANLALTVSPATLSVSGLVAENRSYDATVVATLDASAATLVGVVSGDVVALDTTGASGTFADPDAGTSKPVTVSGLTLAGGDAASYVLVQPTLTADILPATATIALTGLAQVYDGAAKQVTATTTPSGLTVDLTYDGAASAPTDAGGYAISAIIDDPNYAGSADGTLTIAKSGQTIAFDSIADTSSGAASFAVNATASSGLPVTFSVVSGRATIAGNTITLTGSGEVAVRAMQAGNGNYDAATAVDQTFNVSQDTASITLEQLDQTYDGSPRRVVATTTPAGLSVTILYAGESEPPVEPGRYLIEAAIDDGLHEGTTTGTLLVRAPHEMTFCGAFGGDSAAGEFVAVVAPDFSSATLVGFLPGRGQGFVLELAIGPDGAFASTTTALTAEGGEASTFTFSGHLTNEGIAGAIEELDLDFSGTRDEVDGPGASEVGYYAGSSLETASGSIHTVARSSGEVFVLTIAAHEVDVASGALTTNGGFAAETDRGTSIAGSINAVARTVTGVITHGNSVVESFSGLHSGTVRTDRLLNLSSRGPVGRNSATMIAGFVVTGGETRRLLIRAAGPSLGPLGVANAAADPRLAVFDAQGRLILSNDDWDAAAVADEATRLHAFAFPADSKDAALVADLAPGMYTLHVTAAVDGAVVLAEVYDAGDPAATSVRLINSSARGLVGTGEGSRINGFVISGNAPKRVLVRGVGPGLYQLGVEGTLVDPVLKLYDHAGKLIAANDDWHEPQTVMEGQVAASAIGISNAGAQAHAFGLAHGSHDAALITTLAPGIYTAVMSSADGSIGVGLLEVYELSTP